MSIFNDPIVKKIEKMSIQTREIIYVLVSLSDYLYYLLRTEILSALSNGDNLGKTSDIVDVLAFVTANSLTISDSYELRKLRLSDSDSENLEIIRSLLTHMLINRNENRTNTVIVESLFSTKISNDSRVAWGQMLALAYKKLNEEYTMSICIKQLDTFTKWDRMVHCAIGSTGILVEREGMESIISKSKQIIKNMNIAGKEAVFECAQKIENI